MFDFPTTPATGTTVTVPDGSFRVWDSQKWRAAPSAAVTPPPGSYLPLAGGPLSGILNLVDPGGAIQSQRAIAFTTPSTNPANQPFELINTFTGTNLDPPTGAPVLATSLTNIFNGFNTGGIGMRGFQVWTQLGPGSMGSTYSAVTSTVTQNAPHPPGSITGTSTPFPWVANQDYPTAGVGVFNSLGQPYYVVTPGHSAASGPGPQGQGSAITDGTVVWAYQGPGYPTYWAPSTSYPTRGVLVNNPNNGGLFRVETPGVSGAAPGPVRYTNAQVAAGSDRNAVPDGTVVWSQKGIGNNATQYIGFAANSQAAFNVGGQNFNESVGHQWGAVIGTRLTSAATFWSENVGLEVDDNVNGSVRKTVALQVVKQGYQGQFTDIGIWLNSTVNVAGVTPAVANPRYKNAIMISRAANINSGYGISFETFGNFDRQHMAGCIDMRMVLPDGTTGPFGNGFVLRHVNGMLDQFGAWQMRYGSITPTASGLTIDVTNVELQSIAITSGGANWQVGDGWKATDGSFGTVQTVSGGAILTVAIVVPSQVPASAMPATVTLSPFNPEGVFAALGDSPVPGTVGSTGDVIWATPATGTPTYAAAAAPTLSLMPSGGATVFGGAATFTGSVRMNSTVGFNNTTPIAKPTVSGAKGSNAALVSLITALASYGLITDTTTA